MSDQIDPLDRLCLCGRPYGEHTLRDQRVCAETEGWTLPWEAVPGGLGEALNDCYDSVVVKSMAAKTAFGCFPVLRMQFASSGRPGQIREVTLLLSAARLKDVARLFSTSVDKACVAARRLR